MNMKTTSYGNTGRTTPTIKKNAPAPTKLTAEQRHKLIEMKAYYLAEKRGFQGGDPVSDWLQAEKDVDSRLGYNA
jgi:hypothetical protein